MNIAGALQQDLVCFLQGKTKREVLHELAELLSASGKVGGAGALEEAVLAREELMSTGIGLGLAVPHVRLEQVASPLMAVGIHREGIADYESMDGKPVHAVILIAAGRQQHAEYIRLLGEVTSLLKSADVREALFHVQDPSEAFRVLTSPSSEG